MLIHPQFDPIAFSLGPIAVRWYGLMYLTAFAALWSKADLPDWKLWARWRLIHARAAMLTDELVAEDFSFYGKLLSGKQCEDWGLANVSAPAEALDQAIADFVAPMKDKSAKRYPSLTFDEAIVKNLKVMDATALALCRDQNMLLKVFSIFVPGALKRVVMGGDEGTLVHC